MVGAKRISRVEYSLFHGQFTDTTAVFYQMLDDTFPRSKVLRNNASNA